MSVAPPLVTDEEESDEDAEDTAACLRASVSDLSLGWSGGNRAAMMSVNRPLSGSKRTEWLVIDLSAVSQESEYFQPKLILFRSCSGNGLIQRVLCNRKASKTGVSCMQISQRQRSSCWPALRPSHMSGRHSLRSSVSPGSDVSRSGGAVSSFASSGAVLSGAALSGTVLSGAVLCVGRWGAVSSSGM